MRLGLPDVIDTKHWADLIHDTHRHMRELVAAITGATKAMELLRAALEAGGADLDDEYTSSPRHD